MSEGVLFSRLLEGLMLVPLFKKVGERSTAKKYCPVSLLSVVSKVFEKFVNNRIVVIWRNMDFFLNSSIVLCLFNRLQIS